MSAPNQWRRGKHARPGRYRIPNQRERFLLFLLAASLLLLIASVPVAHEVGTHVMQEALAR